MVIGRLRGLAAAWIKGDTMDNEKELLTEEQELNELETANDEPETEEESDVPETTEEPEEETPEDDKSDTKAEKRINKLTAINKSLQEQLKEAKDALDEAKEALERKDQALDAEKKSFAGQFDTVWTKNGKQMYELSEDEFDEVVDSILSNPDPDQAKKLLSEVRAQRKQGRPLLKKQEEVDKGEQQLWEYEWGIITKAMLDEETGNPELEKYVSKLADQIAPIFLNRKEDKELAILYRQLTDGGVDAKMKHLKRLMKKMDLYKLIDSDVEIPATTTKGKKSPAVTSEKTFTRAQIEKMSAEEYAKNEAAIDRAMAKGLIK